MLDAVRRASHASAPALRAETTARAFQAAPHRTARVAGVSPCKHDGAGLRRVVLVAGDEQASKSGRRSDRLGCDSYGSEEISQDSIQVSRKASAALPARSTRSIPDGLPAGSSALIRQAGSRWMTVSSFASLRQRAAAQWHLVYPLCHIGSTADDIRSVGKPECRSDTATAPSHTGQFCPSRRQTQQVRWRVHGLGAARWGGWAGSRAGRASAPGGRRQVRQHEKAGTTLEVPSATDGKSWTGTCNFETRWQGRAPSTRSTGLASECGAGLTTSKHV